MVYGETAPRDENQIPALLGTDASTGNTTVKIYANPTTHRLLVESATGGVTGPVSSTDNAIVRWDGVTGLLLQNSLVIIDDSGHLTAATLNATNGATGSFTTVDLKTVTVVNGIITSIA